MRADRHGPDIKLLRRLGAVFDGVPAERVDLGEIYVMGSRDKYAEPDPNLCGTIGCFMGWVGMHPIAHHHGVRLVSDNRFHIRGIPGTTHGYAYAASFLFNISFTDALELFGPTWTRFDPERWSNDKERILARIKNFIKEQETWTEA